MTINLQTDASQQLYDQACQVIPGGVSSSMRKNVKPLLYFDRADGPYFYDVDGNEYVDYTLAWGPLIVGSNHEAINKAVTAQLQKSYTLGAQHELEVRLATRLTDILPGVEQVLFCNTGSEAVQGAIRIARTQTGRKKIVKFEGHYHGWLNNVLVSYKPRREQLGTASAAVGGQPASEYADTLVLPWNDLDALAAVFEQHPNEIACVLTEPILANSGCCMPTDGFLSGLISLCRKHGAISVFDEVITGFRIALGGAREYFNLRPDLSVYAKAIAGGFTMAAIGGTKEIFDVIREGSTIHAGTYNGSAINLAASLATLEILSADHCYPALHAHGDALRAHIEEEARQYRMPLITAGVGSVFSMHFGLDKLPLNYTSVLDTDMALYERFRVHMLQEGVLLLPDGRWYVGTTHGPDELTRTKVAITRTFAALHQPPRL
jgi:glutamate-1-semialdehyde 2,1-aminomutase